MMRHVSKEQVQKLIGRNVYVQRKDGSVVAGKLERLQGDRLYMRVSAQSGGKKVHTRAFILPLVLFDLLAIGTLPYAGFGGGYGCPGPYPGPCGPGPYGKPGPYGPGPYGPGPAGGYSNYGGYPGYGPKGFY
ncbi:hypothetical protein [Paenibacillus beijingensis]|uniref:Uncharacterized protein n=1 Tax=Paenibacillus beijingensis TaxID=1126833 RepID=A0A0D5NEA3_9BACL|nr:hypothetical protein [Paenibacillus beijingensis]AJY73694.1 hypothetical protein VN24_02415 [Paenibacillus beijingensis]